MHADTTSLTTAGLNLIAQALSIYDADLRLVVCNARFQSMFNLPQRYVTPGASFADTIQLLAEAGDYGEIEDMASFVAEKVEIARAFEPHYVERRRANGRVISVEGSPLPQGGWVTVYSDITQVKQQETLLRSRASELSELLLNRSEALAASNRELAATISALREAQRELTESEARTRLTTEMMPAHIAHVDAQGRYTYSNRRLSAILPDRPNAIEGMDVADALGASAYRHIRPHLGKAYEGEATVFEFTDDTSARRIRVAFTPDEDGGVYILSMDVTKETQARVALQQTRKREVAAQLTSGLAHDFSNLLTIILGQQSKLSKLPDLPDAARDLSEGIRSAALRGGALLEGIASLTNMRTARPKSINLGQMLEDFAALAKPTLPDDIALEIEIDLPQGPHLVDPGLLQDCLLNLILNARDACGTTGRITLKVHEVSETWLEFTVTDTGPGFSDEALSRALDPFYTTKGSGGSGLGLSMVYDVTKSAGGTLSLQNRRGDGAQVSIRLPLRRASNAHSGLVLLVEDDEALRSQVRDMLTEMSHSVIEAVSVDEALALLASLPDISLVLSDLRIEGSATGADLAQQISGQVPTILMTSLSHQDPLYARAAQIAPILGKPFAKADLRDALQTNAVP